MQHRAILLVIGCAVMIAEVHSQRICGQLDLETLPEKVFLLSVKGSAAAPIDSFLVDRKGRFNSGAINKGRGFYRLALNDSDQVDIILDPAERSFNVNFSGSPLQENIDVRCSLENERLWRYKATSREAQAKLIAIQADRSVLEITDTSGQRLLDERIQSIQQEKDTELARVIAEAPQSYFAKVVRASRMLQAAAGNAEAVLQAIDLSDPELLRSSLFPQAVQAYMQAMPLFMEEHFIDIADTLVAEASGDPQCKEYMISYLLDMFATYGPDMAMQHVVDHHVALSGSSSVPVHLQAKVKEMLRVTTGADSPSVMLPDHYGMMFPLDTLLRNHPYTILFFYSSTCDHCHEQMPGLDQLYKEFKPRGLEIVGIALDLDTALFHKTIAERNITWPTYSEFDAWGSPAAKAFQVKATPSLFIVDQQRAIVAKPLHWQQAGEYLLQNLPREE